MSRSSSVIPEGLPVQQHNNRLKNPGFLRDLLLLRELVSIYLEASLLSPKVLPPLTDITRFSWQYFFISSFSEITQLAG